MPFLKNCWYAAGWAEEFGQDLVARQIIGKHLLLFRTADGSVTAISDTCPHRFAPLHKGKRVGDHVECPYHGLQFNADGRCVHNPHGDHAIPKAAFVERYPVVERDTLVWVWMGDRDRVDPSAIPDFSIANDEKTWVHTKWLAMTMGISYELITDNLLDLSHATYLHATLGNEALASGIIDVRQDGNTVYSDRVGINDRPPLLFPAIGACKPDEKVDFWADIRWDAPASFLLHSGVAPTGLDRADGSSLFSIQILTPETETRTRYIIRLMRNFNMENPAVSPAIEENVQAAFMTEDEPMIQNVSDRMGGQDFWELNPILLAGDGGAVRARRIMAQLIEQEQCGARPRAVGA